MGTNGNPAAHPELIPLRVCPVAAAYNASVFILELLPMRRSFLLLMLALAAGHPRAEPAADAALAAVADLGRINGLALACGHPQVVARAKELMLAYVPKTRTYGETYEAATSRAYTQIPGGCGEAAALRLEAEVAAVRIQAALPAER